MFRLSQQFALSFRSIFENCDVKKRASRCDVMEYFNLTRAKNWHPPEKEKEGPSHFGLKSPFCTDCSGCNAFFMRCINITIEYIPVEFSRDREYQTQLSSTSQETVIQYLRKENRQNSWVVMNSGLHDFDFTANVYLENMKYYRMQNCFG